MSYTRDKDAYTRGAGAIAAADYGNARRARERRAKIARSEARDRMLAGYTLGPRGGLGVIDANKLGAGRVGRGYIDPGGSLDAPPQATNPLGKPPQGGGGGGGGRPSYQLPFSIATFSSGGTQPQPQTAVDPGTGAVMIQCWDGSFVPATSAGTGLCPPQTAMPTPPTAPAAAVPGAMSSSRKWLLLAAIIGGGAYLLLKDRP